MNAEIEVKKSDHDRLIRELNNLQRDCAKVLRLVASTRHKEYENLAKIYLWWKEASSVEGFLEGVLAEFKDYRLQAVAHGYNYAPVLMLMFGKTLSDQERNKMSRALNALNNEFNRHPQTYRFDAVAKLTGFIKKSGGLVQLVKPSYKKAELSVDLDQELVDEMAAEEHEAQQADQNAAMSAELAKLGVSFKVVKTNKKAGEPEIKEKEKIKVLSKEAGDFWSQNQPLGFATFSSGVAANDDGYSYVLVKRNGTEYSVVNTVIDKGLINEGLVTAYRKQFAALPASVRTVCETLRTQLLPINVKLNDSELVEINAEGSSADDQKLARARLLHISQSNQFVLSQVGLSAGVVTQVTPVGTVLEKVDHDVVMAPFSKFSAETRLVGNVDFNLYKPLQGEQIPKTEDPNMIFSHRLDLVNKANESMRMSLLFHSFIEKTGSYGGQPVYDNAYDMQIEKRVNVSCEFIGQVGNEFAMPWLDNIGTHMVRPSNQLIKLRITDSQMLFSYKYLGGEFKEHKACSYGDGLSANVLTEQVFLTKDLMPVLAGLAYLPIIGGVQVKADQYVLSLSFSTSAADYLIAIPTYDIAAKRRSTVGFSQYMPTLRELNEAEQEEQYINKIMAKHSIKDHEGELLIPGVDQSEGVDFYA